jgi:hypothetical protein
MLTLLRNELPGKKRIEDVCFHICGVLGQNTSCEIVPVGQSGVLRNGCGLATSMPVNIEKHLLQVPSTPTLNSDNMSKMDVHASADSGSASVCCIDNALSPVHSMLQVDMKDRKGLVYDCLRFLRDVQMKVFHDCNFFYHDSHFHLVFSFII